MKSKTIYLVLAHKGQYEETYSYVIAAYDEKNKAEIHANEAEKNDPDIFCTVEETKYHQ